MNYHFTNPEDKKLFHLLHPVLQALLLGCVVPWINTQGHEPTFTRTVDEMLEYSTTDIHAQFRAGDMRTKDMRPGLAIEIEIKFNEMFAEKYGAISARDGKKRFVVYEKAEGEKGEHLHFQVRNGLSMMALIKDIENGNFTKLCY